MAPQILDESGTSWHSTRPGFDSVRYTALVFISPTRSLCVSLGSATTRVILIVVAVSAYGKKPEYELFAPGELPREARIIALGLVDHVEPTRLSSPIDSETIEWMQAKPRL